MRDELVEGLDDAAGDPEARCVVLRGDSRAFCAGGDVKAMTAAETPIGTVRRLGTAGELIQALYNLPKPVIAAVEGPAVGAGLSIALAADMIVASDTATFRAIFTRRGLVPDTGMTYLLARSVGLARAKYLVLTARTLAAQDARAMGLVAEVWTAGDFDRELTALAGALASGPTSAFSLSKQLLNRAFEMDLGTALGVEALGQAVARTTEDHQASVQAFLAKETPRFVGH
jgi:2-(1,2-epoxy-1,2-dihydrophenyl)acetyl-CoA isomerase